MQAENTAHEISQVKKKRKNKPESTLSSFSENKIMLVKYGYLRIHKGLNHSCQIVLTTVLHYRHTLLFYLYICWYYSCIYLCTYTQKRVREDSREKAGELAGRDSGDMGAQPQGSLSTSLSSAERWLSGRVQTPWVHNQPLPGRKGKDLLKQHSLLFHNQNLIHPLKVIFPWYCSWMINPSEWKHSYLSNCKKTQKPQTICSKQQSSLNDIKGHWLFLLNLCFSDQISWLPLEILSIPWSK